MRGRSLLQTIGDILFTRESMPFEEVDKRFLDELDRLKISSADRAKAFGLWLLFTDQDNQTQRYWNTDEWKFMFPILERIVMRHGFGRIVS